MLDLEPFFEKTHFIDSRPHGTYQPSQWGAQIMYRQDENFDLQNADLVIVGCGEWRGNDRDAEYTAGADAIREELYKLYNWHSDITIADVGNIMEGATMEDTYAALAMVLNEIYLAGKTAIILGGSHDLTLQQYNVFKKAEKMIHVTVADMLVDLDETEGTTDRSYLMELLTGEPNFVEHYNHIGFQSYYAHPKMLETMDKMRFDFFRLGRARESMEEMEPVLRNSQVFSFDINAIRYSDAPVNINGSPNGFTGDEACMLTRYAGMSSKLQSVGIYGYHGTNDAHGMTAKLISQMIWYFIDGYHVRRMEATLDQENEFVTFHVTFTDNDTVFLKSKRTNRWWMKLPGRDYVPCSYNDYLVASRDEIPERWLREQERMM
ncbi:MAG: formimidoylglutamase [Flavipsychrobacter sp.]|nr:formimidoylglutamase [Flavipsychrobacter sp.]